MEYDVKDLALAEKGARRIAWARTSMPVLRMIEERFAKEQPLKGIRVSACLHVTCETANLMRALKTGGAEVRLCAKRQINRRAKLADRLDGARLCWITAVAFKFLPAIGRSQQRHQMRAG